MSRPGRSGGDIRTAPVSCPPILPQGRGEVKRALDSGRPACVDKNHRRAYAPSTSRELPFRHPVNTASLLQFLFSGLMVGAIYALVALGLTVVFNATGAVNFAQGEFSMLGGMLGTATLSATGLPLALVFACTVVAVTAIGVGMERLIVRPVRHADVLNLIIVTIRASILTVRDNLELGGDALPRGRDFASRLASGVEGADDRFPGLRQRGGQLAGTLSGGRQQMLASRRALMTPPRLLPCRDA